MPDLAESAFDYFDEPFYDYGTDTPSLSEEAFDLSGQAVVTSTGDGAAPVVTLVSPSVLEALDRDTAVVIDVTDNVALGRVLVVAQLESLGVEELVHNGDRFAAAFSGSSSRVAIAGGWRYTVRRGGGWAAPPTLTVYAVDATGTEG